MIKVKVNNTQSKVGQTSIFALVCLFFFIYNLKVMSTC